jgi:4-hydroxybenzoyl-CoA thioesterase
VSFRHTSEFSVEFGDCDPAQIVFYPNFFRWMDSAARRFFTAAGVPQWRDMERSEGIIGTPLVEATARFVRPASYGDRIAVDTTVAEWRSKAFVLAHVIRRGDDVLVEGSEVRIFARRHPQDPQRIQAVEVPAAIRSLLE